MKTKTNNFEQMLKNFPGIAAGGEDVFANHGKWAMHFRQRAGSAFGGRIILEIGCAEASFLAVAAEKHPQIGFVGLDWKFKSLHAGAERIAAGGLNNVALLRGRAQDLTRIFSPGELDEVWVFHPEPCAEMPQRKNRLLNDPFLTDVHSVLRDGSSTLAIKTDHPGYYQWMLALLGVDEPAEFSAAREAAQGRGTGDRPPFRLRTRDLEPPADLPSPSGAALARFTVAATSPDYWNDPAILTHTAGRAFAHAATPYEAKFVKKRQPIFYMELQKR